MDAFEIDRIPIFDEIELRRFRDTDAGQIAETVLRNSAHLVPFMDWMTPDYSIESAKNFIVDSTESAKRKESLGFGIFRRDDLLGSIGFVNFDWMARRTEIGYWIDQTEEGRGIVSRCCETLIRVAFDDLDLNRIEIRCSNRNKRSSAIPMRFGFTLEGCLRQSEFRGGQLHDFVIFGLLRSEWEVRNSQ